MRINAYVARASGLSRRAADQAVVDRRVRVNGQIAKVGQTVNPSDNITLDNGAITPGVKTITIMLNKPAGYVCSRAGQGSRTIYDLLPARYHHLKPAGRLDKDSTGLLLLTDDGQLANRLTHPRYGKTKTYEVTLDKPLGATDKDRLEQGVELELEDGPSRLQIISANDNRLTVSLGEGRNRQIRRTFTALGYTVTGLHRTRFGDYELGNLPSGEYRSQT